MADGMTEQRRIGEIIRRHLAYTNGWRVDDETYVYESNLAAENILLYLKRRDSQVNKKSGCVEGLRLAEEIAEKVNPLVAVLIKTQREKVEKGL